MGFKCGIVGLPNVGKSSLFNALIATAAAESANFPFTTIEPNVGRVGVKDPRLDTIVALAKSAKVTPTQLDVVDIAGLVKGASKGEGLGNRFLGNIREVEAVLHVLRCFEDENVTHVMGGVDPIRDADVVETELLLADLESLERRVEAGTKQARGGDKEAKAELQLMERVLAAVRAGRPARTVSVAEDEAKMFRGFQLLTAKPVLYVCNVEEAAAATGNAHSRAVAARAREIGAESVVVSARIEQEVAELADADERRSFLESVGLTESGLDRVVRAGHSLLGLITFFTSGPKEARAWTIPAGTTAAKAAGGIHTDFERGFIAAETIAYDDFVASGGEKGAKDAGRMRLEGRDYVVKDGDVLLFRFNV
ncbi:MAG: redox-regulated ATPase YchF [Rhodospirillales bacterium]|nr:redox-regulated ATPase YchF [Rhodospirillales bacterium]